MAGAGLDTELVEDAERPARVADASLVLIGADTVFRDGTICNKVGTIPLAKAAADAGVPTVVAAEVIKLAPVPGSQAPELADIERSLFELVPAELDHRGRHRGGHVPHRTTSPPSSTASPSSKRATRW